VKKNKTASFDSMLASYKRSFFLESIFIYAVLIVMLGVVLNITYSSTYLKVSEKIITNYAESIKSETDGQTILHNAPNDPRMVVVYYWVDNDSLLYGDGTPQYFIFIQGLNDEVVEGESAFTIDARGAYVFDSMKQVTIGNYKYISYTIDLSNQSNAVFVSGNQIVRAKIYLNIDGEKSAAQQLAISFLVVTIAMLFVSVLAGIYLSSEGTKPLKIFVNRQSTFVSDASHELRTPLSIVRSKLENIMASPDKRVKDVSEDLAISLNELNRLNKLVNDLLIIARSEKKTMNLNMEVCDMKDVISSTIEPFIEILEMQKRQFTYQLSSCYAKVDKDRIKQIMFILLDNATKYSSDGESIDVKLYSNLNNVIIEVSDTGIGVSDATKTKMFERFYRADTSRSTSGNGLGLAIAFSLATAQNGTIIAKDNEPKGTKIVVMFPRVKFVKKEFIKEL